LVFILGILLSFIGGRTIAPDLASGGPQPEKHMKPPRHALPGGFEGGLIAMCRIKRNTSALRFAILQNQ
jgi:hypothetical protein